MTCLYLLEAGDRALREKRRLELSVCVSRTIEIFASGFVLLGSHFEVWRSSRFIRGCSR